VIAVSSKVISGPDSASSAFRNPSSFIAFADPGEAACERIAELDHAREIPCIRLQDGRHERRRMPASPNAAVRVGHDPSSPLP
jgi:hypothetical protein